MLILDNILSGLRQIRDHKLRSSLTLLGIILGTMALITMFSLVDGIKVLVLDGFTQMGYDGVVFISEESPGDRKEAVRFARHGLRMLDLPFLLRNETQFEGISPVIEWRTGALFEGEPRRETFQGVTEQYFLARNRPVCAGRSLTPLDIERCHGVCVLGKLIAEEVYGSARGALGKYITAEGSRFEVIGVLAFDENDFVQDSGVEREQESVFLPITFVMKNFSGNDDIHYMVMKVEDTKQEVSIKEKCQLVQLFTQFLREVGGNFQCVEVERAVCQLRNIPCSVRISTNLGKKTRHSIRSRPLQFRREVVLDSHLQDGGQTCFVFRRRVNSRVEQCRSLYTMAPEGAGKICP